MICGQLGVSSKLDKVEDYIQQDPVSALEALNSLKDIHIKNNAIKARIYLLRSMALDKNYINIRVDSLTLFPYNYYKRFGNNSKRLLSSYYLAIAQQHDGQYLDAVLTFTEALAIAEKQSDLHHIGLINEHMSSIYATNHDNLSAIKYANEAEKAFMKAEEFLSAYYSKTDYANQLIYERSWDDAVAVVDTLLKVSEGYEPLRELAIWQKALILTQWKEDYHAASELLGDSLLLKSGIPVQYQYGLRAQLSEGIGDSISANYYLSLSQDLMTSSLDSLSYWEDAYIVHHLRKDYEGAFNALASCMRIQARQIRELLVQSIPSGLAAYYNLSYKKETEIGRLRVIIFLLVLLVLSGILIFLGKRLKFKDERILQDMEEIRLLRQDTQKLLENASTASAVTGYLLKDKIAVIESLSEAYLEWEDTARLKREAQFGSYSKDEIIRRFRHQLSSFRKDSEIMPALENAVNLNEDNVLQIIHELVGSHLTKDCYDTLTLIFAGVPSRSICFLQNITYSALRTRKTRIRQALRALKTEKADIWAARL